VAAAALEAADCEVPGDVPAIAIVAAIFARFRLWNLFVPQSDALIKKKKHKTTQNTIRVLINDNNNKKACRLQNKCRNGILVM
jgi:hypothetical protein